jgi:hypothetical protein
MEDYLNYKGLCEVCHKERTTIHAEITPGRQLFVCETCLESAKQNFIWICVHCGNVFIRPKALVLRRLKDPVLKRAYAACESQQIIQGIDRCIECAPDEVMEFVAAGKMEKDRGRC